MKEKEISDIFAKASKLIYKNEGFHTREEWTKRKEKFEELRGIDGAKVFKRRALGLCGEKSVKSLDEIAMILSEIGVTSSLEEGRLLVPSLVNLNIKYWEIISYPNRPTSRKSIVLEKVFNESNQENYRIKKVVWKAEGYGVGID